MTHEGVFLVCSSQEILIDEEVLDNVWPTGENTSFSMVHWGTCFDSTHEWVLSTPWGSFFSQLVKGRLCASDPRGSPSMILYFTRDLVDDLNSRVSFLCALATSDPLRDVFDTFNPLGCFEGPCVLYPTKGISIVFDALLNFFFALLIFWEPIEDI